MKKYEIQGKVPFIYHLHTANSIRVFDLDLDFRDGGDGVKGSFGREDGADMVYFFSKGNASVHI